MVIRTVQFRLRLVACATVRVRIVFGRQQLQSQRPHGRVQRPVGVAGPAGLNPLMAGRTAVVAQHFARVIVLRQVLGPQGLDAARRIESVQDRQLQPAFAKPREAAVPGEIRRTLLEDPPLEPLRLGRIVLLSRVRLQPQSRLPIDLRRAALILLPRAAVVLDEHRDRRCQQDQAAGGKDPVQPLDVVERLFLVARRHVATLVKPSLAPRPVREFRILRS